MASEHLYEASSEHLSSTSTASSTASTGPNDVSPNFRVVKLILYVLIFLVSAVGNSLVCLVILRKRKMKTVTNYFILNLAIADLTLTCICIPFDIPLQELDYVWPYGSFMCRILYPLQTLSLLASVYTLTALSLTRYRAIVHPLNKQLTNMHAKCIICAIWLFSVLLVSPYMAALEIRNDHLPKCKEEWSSQSTRKAYTVCLFMFEYVLPLSIIAGAYTSIGIDLRRRSRNGNRFLQDIHAVETRKVVRMLKVVTLLFAVCVLPTNIVWLWLDFGEADKHFSRFWEIVAFCNIVTFANSASNPICYTILNEHYRNEFKDILSKCVQKITGRKPLRRESIEMRDKEHYRKPRTATMSSAL